MKRLLVFLPCLLAAPVLAEPRELRASGWLNFNEAMVRLVVETPRPGETRLAGGVHMRLKPGYKTYWRTPGDSGVPPVFDFSGSTGVRDIAVAYPMPGVFDDGAGGTAFGYKSSLIFPLAGTTENPAPILVLKLDFAVCGTMCIPLSGELRFEAAQAQLLPANAAKALAAARARVPAVLAAAEAERAIKAQRLSGSGAAFRLELASRADPETFALFAEARGHFEIGKAERAGEGRLAIGLSGTPAPGSGGRFGPVRLTFGNADAAFEAMIDLDSLPGTP